MEIGKWYKNTKFDKILFYVTESTKSTYKAYGFNWRGKWIDETDYLVSENYKDSVEATKEEVESALIKEAERRGLWRNYNGIRFFNDNPSITDYYAEGFDVAELWSSHGLIYKDGKWAEIVEEAKPESMRVQLKGNNVEKVPDTDYNKPIKVESPTITILDSDRKELGKIYRTTNKYYLHIGNEIVESSSVEDCLIKTDNLHA